MKGLLIKDFKLLKGQKNFFMTITAISICIPYWNLYHQFFERGNMETSSGLILCKGEILLPFMSS